MKELSGINVCSPLRTLWRYGHHKNVCHFCIIFYSKWNCSYR